MSLPARVEKDFFKLPEDMSFEDWEKTIQQNLAITHLMPFRVGDLMVFGEGKFGEEAFQAVEAYNFHTLQNWASIARAFPAESGTRSPDIAYGVYVVLAGIKSDAKRWALAKEAVKDRWTIKQAAEQALPFKDDRKPKKVEPAPSEEDDSEGDSEGDSGDMVISVKSKEWNQLSESAQVILQKYAEKGKKVDDHAVRIAEFFGLSF